MGNEVGPKYGCQTIILDRQAAIKRPLNENSKEKRETLTKGLTIGKSEKLRNLVKTSRRRFFE
jgi:hypothetical protein